MCSSVVVKNTVHKVIIKGLATPKIQPLTYAHKTAAFQVLGKAGFGKSAQKEEGQTKMIVMEIFFGQLVLGILCGFLTEYLKGLVG